MKALPGYAVNIDCPHCQQPITLYEDGWAKKVPNGHATPQAKPEQPKPPAKRAAPRRSRRKAWTPAMKKRQSDLAKLARMHKDGDLTAKEYAQYRAQRLAGKTPAPLA